MEPRRNHAVAQECLAPEASLVHPAFGAGGKYVLSTMTAPVVAAGVPTSAGPKDMLFILGANNVLYALDANGGEICGEKLSQSRYAAEAQGIALPRHTQ